MAKKESQKLNQSQENPKGEGTNDIPSLPVLVNAQYIKDLSFENPSPLKDFDSSESQPQIELNVDIQAQEVDERVYEVTLHLVSHAKQAQENMFIIELQYAGIFTLATNLPQEAIHPVLMIECPRLLFPYARSLIATLTREGGFPALSLHPIDFLELYKKQYSDARPSQH